MYCDWQAAAASGVPYVWTVDVSSCSSGDGATQLAHLVDAVHGCLVTKAGSRWPLERVYDVVTDVVTRVGPDTAAESLLPSPPARAVVQPPPVPTSPPAVAPQKLYPILAVLDALPGVGVSPDALDTIADAAAANDVVALRSLPVITAAQRIRLEALAGLRGCVVGSVPAPVTALAVDLINAMEALGLIDAIEAVASAVEDGDVPIAVGASLAAACVRGRDIARVRRHLLVRRTPRPAACLYPPPPVAPHTSKCVGVRAVRQPAVDFDCCL